MTARNGRKKGKPTYAERTLGSDAPPNYDDEHPVFCLRHIHPEFNVKHAAMTKEHRAAFAEQLETLASLTWKAIKLTGRKALGSELIPIGQLKLTMPAAFADAEKVWVFRYHNGLPMAGVRDKATLHIIAVERQFNDLYKHS